MKPFDWNPYKNKLLRKTRGVGFEDVVNAIHENCLLTILEHPNREKYPNQRVYIVAINNYAYAVPFVDNKKVCFLKTIYPSRKYTKQFLSKKE